MTSSAEEECPLMHSPSAEYPSGTARRNTRGSTRGVILTALAGMCIVGSLVSRTATWRDVNLSTAVESDGESTLLFGKAARLYGGLINPNNGTENTQTTTEDCVGDFTLPVLGGVDVVAYWDLEAGAEPVFGTPSLMAVHENYRFYFSSAENLRTFERDPDKYVPAFGGFCTYGIAEEARWTIDNLGPFADPAMWVIASDGKLHVFRSPWPLIEFGSKPQEYLADGYAIWNGWFPPDEGSQPLNTACLCDEEMCPESL